MAISDNFSVVITTTSNEEQAKSLATAILNNKLAACIQIQNIHSIYSWKEEICTDAECLLLIKTTSALYTNLEQFIKSNHPYEIPEIIELPIKNGLPQYLSWIKENTHD